MKKWPQVSQFTSRFWVRPINLLQDMCYEFVVHVLSLSKFYVQLLKPGTICQSKSKANLLIIMVSLNDSHITEQQKFT